MMKRKTQDIIDDALKEGVIKIISIGIDINSCKKNMSYAEQYDNVYISVGFHPHESKYLNDEGLLLLEKMSLHSKNVAIGEIGLDYYHNHSTPEEQKRAFQLQIELANKHNLPIIIHDRDAHKDVLKMLQEKAKGKKVVFHCFSGDVQMAKWCLEQDFYFGIGGVVTFKNAFELGKVVKEIPLNRILLETDAPFLTPHPFRGKPNEPKYIPLIAERIAMIKGITIEEIASITTQNAQHFFNI